MSEQQYSRMCAIGRVRSLLFHAGYAISPPGEGPQEREALIQLFGACLSGDLALHGKLADLLLHASHTLAACRKAGTDRARCQGISDGLSRAVAALKLKVGHAHAIDGTRTSELFPGQRTYIQSWGPPCSGMHTAQDISDELCHAVDVA